MTIATTLTVVIPGTPDRCLSPNARVHWATKARATSLDRQTAHHATYGAMCQPPWLDPPLAPPFRLDFVIGWEKGRKSMDPQNAIAILKATCDGIADALGVNDKHFTMGTVDQVRDPDGVGFVRVTITPVERSA